MHTKSRLVLSLALVLSTSLPAWAWQAPSAELPIPDLKIECVRVLDHQSKDKTPKDSTARDEPLDKKAPANVPEQALATPCASSSPGVLIGTGDVLIALSEDRYKELEKYQEAKGIRASLYINGINLRGDAQLVSIERLPPLTVLRYNITPGENSKMLWSSLYRIGKTTERHPMNAALGFVSGPITSGATSPPAQIQITDQYSFRWALGLITALVAFAAVLGYSTDIFRDGKTPDAFRRAILARRKFQEKGADKLAVLTDLYPQYDPADYAAYALLARQALDGEDMRNADMNKLAVGLVLAGNEWSSARASYSLGRVQLGMWFLFAVATGGFLWVIYGELPELDGSLLALLGLSIGVTGVSLAVDVDNPNVRFSRSRGFFHDLITDFDDHHQVYRFQAVVVNLLLLMVGIFHVSQHLTYPIFEPTWLAFLGLSGAALAGGKSIVETKPSDAEQALKAAEDKVAAAKAEEAKAAAAKAEKDKGLLADEVQH